MTSIVCHVGLAVTDLERSMRFYTELLGFEYDREMRGSSEMRSKFLGIDPPVEVATVILRRDAFQLELLHYVPAARPAARERGMHETGLTHLAIAVDSPTEVAAQSLAFGCTPFTSLGDKACVLRDPDGQLIELLTLDYVRRNDEARAAGLASA